MDATKKRSKASAKSLPKNVILRGRGFTFRKVAPADVPHVFGGIGEYTRALGNVSLRKAEELAAIHRVYCNRLIDEARGKAKPEKSIIELLRIQRVPDREEIERTVRDWLLRREAALGTSLSGDGGAQKARDIEHIQSEVIRVASQRKGAMPLLTGWIAEELAEANGWALPPDGELRRFLEDRVGRAQNELSERVGADQGWGKVRKPPHPMFEAARFDRDRDHHQCRPVPIRTILDGYLGERKPAASTVKAWKSAVNSLIAHLGHDDAARVTSDDIVAWKDALLAAGDGGGRGALTVRHKYLGGVKPIFGWAKKNRIIPENPVAGVTVMAPKRMKLRATKGFTDAEAKQVLSAALAVAADADQSFLGFARRWLPWLCAYTGARVGEMAQLRRQDIAQNEEGIWYLTITPEAGSQKGNFARQVAIHPHLIDQGFIEAIKRRSGPLFYDPTRARKGSVGNPQHKKVAQRVADWVRHTVGLTDPELQPNHGWRHRFITIAKDIGMDGDIRRAIVGHAAIDEHGDYGDTLIRSSYRALAEFPRYVVEEDGSVGSPPRTREILQPVATTAE